MRRALTMVVLLSLAPLAGAVDKPADGTLLDRAVIQPAAFESVKRLERYVSREEHEKIAAEKEWVLERVGYASDGLRVTAWVYRPTGTVRSVLAHMTPWQTSRPARPQLHRQVRASSPD